MKNETKKTEEITGEHYEFNEAERERAPLAGHQWRQHGIVVSCRSCPFEHSFLVDPELTLTGLDADGFPIFIKTE